MTDPKKAANEELAKRRARLEATFASSSSEAASAAILEEVRKAGAEGLAAAEGKSIMELIDDFAAKDTGSTTQGLGVQSF